MKASAINSFKSGENTFGTDNFLAGNINGNSIVGNANSAIPGGGINPFRGDGGSKLQQLIFDRLKLVLGDDFPNDAKNPFAGGKNPFTNGGTPQSPFDPLNIIRGGTPYSGNNPAGGLPFNKDNAPIGNANKDSGSNNATLGNLNSNFGNDSATIGNGNWNFNNSNATIGNGNWQFGGDNATIGNGNWYWDDGSNNLNLGNGNWHFGSDNATIGNGNWDFGSNNTIIGNGNWVFTSGNTIVGNGNWLEDKSNTTINVGNNTSQELRADVDTVINSLMGGIGKDFIELTGNLDASDIQTFNRLILSKGNSVNASDAFGDIKQLLASVTETPGNGIPYPPVHNPQSVPEPTFSVPLVVMGLVCLLWSKFKKVG
ncbi:hypothetical protein I8752_05740 [Nostocaceae cyanobacterium CENA369]|uniref:Uncharacterized protein n=1 Tax=Dendronalium phyllosphericum CENA369 TaxID=1725256 RepID=A0A8J7I4U4_9NOST|nr:hypothetical protein [Dendronalium phyllosphericum]MBH8572547.1 hypothetical protein [Dendronalium phyllosphericum CENA369]